jgi:diguanylate cyclase (GGDEF)-like protein
LEYEEILSIQRKFSKFNKLFYILIIFFATIQMKIYINDMVLVLICVFVIISTIIECIIDLKKVDETNIISFFRYFQFGFMAFLLMKAEYVYTFGIILLCLIIFTLQFFLSLDFLDSYSKSLFYFGMGFPLLIFVVLGSIYDGITGNVVFARYILIVMFVISFVFFSIIFVNFVKQSLKKIYGQARLIDNINKINEGLMIQQGQVKKSNELLGEQKIKLEAAYNEINRVNSEMRIQDEIIKYISSSLELGKLMTLITDSILNQIGVSVCAIVLYSGAVNNHLVKYKIKTKLGSDMEDRLSESIEAGCFENYLRGNRICIDNRVTGYKYSFIEGTMVGSLIIIPLVQDKVRIGALFVAHPSYNYFNNYRTFFEGIVAQFLIALNNANLYAKMEHMAIRDGLTGIYNRRYLTKIFDEILHSTMIDHTHLTIALFDIDKFKRVNDTYGHLFGDVVIQSIANLAEKTAEKCRGIVGRYGGEEFVIIFPNRGIDEVYMAIEELRNNVKKEELMHDGKKVKVSVSIGITSYPETCKTPSELLNRADWAMYDAKEKGRDLIIVDNDEITKNHAYK